MNKIQHLLLKLGEECSEVTKCASKASLFGLEETNILRPDGPNNTEKLCDELNDLYAVVEMLEDEGILPVLWEQRDEKELKKKQVLEFMKYSIERGLTDE